MGSGYSGGQRVAAIPTMRNGIQFRSRLEARWSAFFDIAGWRWSYEPIDLNGWIPDFVLHLAKPILVEVKPALTEDELREHCAKINAARPEYETLLVGADVGLVKDRLNQSVSVGLLGEWCEDRGTPVISWGAATAFNCTCGMAFAHDVMDYRCRVCAKESAHQCGYNYVWPVRAMRIATNETQWRRPQ